MDTKQDQVEIQGMYLAKKEAHAVWLNLPMTQTVLRALTKQEDMLVNNQTTNAEVTLSAIRTVRAVKQILNSFDLISNLTK